MSYPEERVSRPRGDGIAEAGRRRAQRVVEAAGPRLSHEPAPMHHEATAATVCGDIHRSVERHRSAKDDGDGVGIDVPGDRAGGESAVRGATWAIQARIDEDGADPDDVATTGRSADRIVDRDRRWPAEHCGGLMGGEDEV